jgi:preprotein translocase subunit SecA
MYKKLAGMTGTADTEAAEFKKIYNLEVVIIPTNRDLVRNNYHDQVYKTEREKFEAVVEEITGLTAEGRPVLVGTISIEKSERLASMLKRRGIPHHVLNAKYHEREAEIISQAGRSAAVTIATNMAGRGTDILLGGNPEAIARQRFRVQEEKALGGPPYEEMLAGLEAEARVDHEKVVAAGGLHIIGTERHESRRIDNQLRGRSGRQGDPGSSRFYLSLEDDLLRIFGSDRISGIMEKIGMEEGQPIEHGMVTRAIENAQKRVEAHNFDIRKQILEYDDVMNQQREFVYSQRRQILTGADLHDDVLGMIDEVAQDMIESPCPRDARPDEWDRAALETAFRVTFGIPGLPPEARDTRDRDELGRILLDLVHERYRRKEEEFGPEQLRHMERFVMLQILDNLWKDHLYAMDALREGIGLRAVGQKNPLIEYKREGFDMFDAMMQRVREEVVQFVFRVEMVRNLEHRRREAPRGIRSDTAGLAMNAPRVTRSAAAQDDASRSGETVTVRRQEKKVGRNEPCPCGSGKKFKKCCGASAP